MSQQGERPAAHEDDWWRRLYDDSAPDTGASHAADSLDDRFDSASDAVGPDGSEASEAAAAVPEPRVAPSEAAPVPLPPPLPPPPPVRAPWEPPVGASEPRTFAAPASASDAALAPEVAPVPEAALAPEAAPAPVEPQSVGEAAPAQVSPPLRPVDPRVAQGLLPGRGAEEPPAAEAPTLVSPPPVPPADTVPPVPPADTVPPVPPADTVPPVPPADTSVPPLPRWPVVERTADERPEAEAPAAPAPVVPAAEARAPRPAVAHVGARPPTYDAEPTALPATDPHEIHSLVADTVLDGASYGTYTLRAASVRGDSARFRGEPRRDALLTVRFGTAESALVLVAVAGGARAAEGAHPAAVDACRWIGEAVGRSHLRLSEDIRAGRRSDLKSGLHRLADRSYGKLRARAAELGLQPHEYTAGLRCLLLSTDPDCRTRVFFGVGGGGLFRLRDGRWRDLEPTVPHPCELTGEGVVGFGSAVPESGPGGERLTMDLGITTGPSPYIESPVPPPAEPFRFRASVARPGDTLLLCSTGLSDPLRDEPALADELAERWAPGRAPGLAAFLADTQIRVKGYADDRTAVGVWEA
ncbi:protein phosphatase 2C domain-containing protein [Streptomyces brevispora]|uniref:Protein phosphatase 2C domain-containing protein n=1 Tax=Streptomyces brevispora TaxID=887462 RepID=A0ABZ1FY44_9ACTN|nr:protein phosphatase 2C domain-containing protein [Streptomyces brevispora]WSC12514.1 protein phosphatase 2C domain-containing protein [Streptomyces brevispora]